MNNGKWESVEEVHNHAKAAIGKQIREIIKEGTIKKYYDNPKNKGWVGNSIESDWFYIPNNSRHEADIPYLNLEIKATPIIKHSKNKVWSAKERLVLNIFDFNDEYKRTFETASFIEKASLIEMLYYEFIKDIPSPDLFIKQAVLLKLWELPEEDMLIIKNDWQTIINKIKEGKAEELSDSLTQYLGATTKGGKSEKNMTTQPFSDEKAHRRSFTLKTNFMSYLAKRFMSEDYTESERIISDVSELQEKSFEQIILDKFLPYIGKTKAELGKQFNVNIPQKDDKASSRLIARAMLNLDVDLNDTEEFVKANIALKIVTINPKARTRGTKLPKTTEGFKLQNWSPEFTNIHENFEDSSLFTYLSETRFLLAVFEETPTSEIFKGVKFWNVPVSDIYGNIQEVFVDTKRKIAEGIELTYKVKNTKKGYEVKNNFIPETAERIAHVRPDAGVSDYQGEALNRNGELKNAMQLPSKSKWINRPEDMKEELKDYYMTKQAYWLNPTYMYEAVKELFFD
ncbi:DNA mismatch repair protein MutH [Bacillus sp. OV322]|uniref:Sau3AI family type II restriction endonuclease n=1 Tax=Bacillus sp. OV322 TaxID=1882764 RepID=UPI0008E005C9|nr:Sau3AI family type II restriction endonuclease [Bacillus sp. OV322]SFB98987.1 DNA mismatch repair protein MutH [Bacillus sp. OV322]